MSNKTFVNSLTDGIVQLAILCIYMRRIINYDWATVNISVLIQQRNISFQNDIFLKTRRLGVLSWKKLKNCESHDSIESSPGRVKKGSKIHKLSVPKLAIVRIWNISNSTWRQLIFLWKVQNHNVRSSGHNARLVLLDGGTRTIDLRQLLFWHRKFSWNQCNYERSLHPSDKLACRSVHNNSFLTLRVIHELKGGSGFRRASSRFLL